MIWIKLQREGDDFWINAEKIVSMARNAIDTWTCISTNDPKNNMYADETPEQILELIHQAEQKVQS